MNMLIYNIKLKSYYLIVYDIFYDPSKIFLVKIFLKLRLCFFFAEEHIFFEDKIY